MLAPKVVGKAVAKRKADGKDDHPPKKTAIIPGDQHPKKLSPRKPNHGVGKKGLMTTLGPVTQGPERHLLTHKDYAIEVMESILKNEKVDPCVEQATEELGASGVFDLARVFHFIFCYFSSLPFTCA